MQANIIYEFDEFSFADGTYFSTYGKAEIEGEIDPFGLVERWEATSIYLSADKDFIAIDDRHPLWTAIMRGLQTESERIEERLVAEAEDNCGPFRDNDAEHSAAYRASAL